MNESPLNVLVLGNRDLLPQGARSLATRTAADFATLRQFIGDEGWFPDLVVVVQDWPDQFSQIDVDDLLRLCPLARIVCCFGPWCDSDGRTRSIWPLAVRVPIVAAEGRLAKELSLLAHHETACRPLPLTASRAEIFEFDFKPLAARGPTPSRGAVISPDGRFRQMLKSVLSAWGLQSCEADDVDPPGVIVFDADPWDVDRQTALRMTRSAHPRAKLVACAGFPRPDLDAALRRSGADAVWFKLAPLDELAKFVVPPSGGFDAGAAG
jgi:hypothetical protein